MSILFWAYDRIDCRLQESSERELQRAAVQPGRRPVCTVQAPKAAPQQVIVTAGLQCPLKSQSSSTLPGRTPSMIGQSWPEYIFIRISIFGLRAIAPASIVYLVASAYTGALLWSPIIGAYAIIEASFCLLVYWPRRLSMQRVRCQVLCTYCEED